MSDAIIVQDLGKRFRRYHANRPNTLQEAVLNGLRGLKPAEYLWALRHVTFSVPRGSMLGVIGHNGAGKSTLLRMLGGVGKPDEGQVRVYGRIGALLDLGAGFHPDLTGRENVFINGVISGLTRQEVSDCFESIIDFAELEDFVDHPLRTYSTGMRMRLAFAIAVHISPEILLIDEVLAVGDLAFQSKCLDRITQFKAQGTTIVLVSHDAEMVQRLCDEVLWLKHGQAIAQGGSRVVVGQYVIEMTAETKRRTPTAASPQIISNGVELSLNENRFGSLEIQITEVRLLNDAGLPAVTLVSGDSLRVEIEYVAPQPTASPIFGVTISRDDNLVCYDTSTVSAKIDLPVVPGSGKIILQLDRLDLNQGLYYVDVGIYEQNWAYAYDYHWHVYQVIINSNNGEKGILSPPHHWKLEIPSSVSVTTTR